MAEGKVSKLKEWSIITMKYEEQFDKNVLKLKKQSNWSVGIYNFV